jgi:CheY-like chemotaxis protein
VLIRGGEEENVATSDARVFLHDGLFAGVLSRTADPSDVHDVLADLIGRRRPATTAGRPEVVTAASNPADVVHPRPEPPPAAEGGILVVEDNVVNQKVIQILIGKQGVQADVVSDGPDALARLRERSYDLVFMDVQMPGMDGYELTRRIRADLPPASQPFIVAMTAHAMEGDREKCLESGMDDYISKPVREDDVRRALQRRRVRPRGEGRRGA